MTDPGLPRPSPLRSPVLLFDGVCNLCNAAVQWIIERDRGAVFRFASLQSAAARGLLEAAGVVDRDALPDSLILIDEDGVHFRSAAALRVAGRLGFPYSLLTVGRLLPRPLRDAAYRVIARNRYRWFGRRDACMVPSPELAARFLDSDEAYADV